MRTILACVLILGWLGECSASLARAAVEDRHQFPREDWGNLYYLVADETTARVLGWVFSSTSLTQEVERCLPQPVVEGLWRMDLRELGWRNEDWKKVLESHPYGGFSLLVRGDWLVTEILDAALSASVAKDGIAAYYRLLYKGNPPKDEGEFLKFWEIDDAKSRSYGMVEGRSGVNRRGRRWLETRGRHAGYFWITRDALTLNSETDPLERPDGSFKHDGSEAIVGVEKFSSRTFERGTVQYYILTNGQGGVVNEAPVQLVEDSTRFRNVASIRTWGSCLKCHVDGIRPTKVNALVELSRQGTAVFSKTPEELRRFHYGSLEKAITRAQEDYAAAVRMHTGWTGEQLVEATESVVRGYDSSIDAAQAAAELGVSEQYLIDTIRHYGQSQPVPAGVAVLAGGGVCSRDLFAEQFEFLDQMLKGNWDD